MQRSKNYSVKKLIFWTTSLLLIMDIIFLPFVTKPFVFEGGITENYFFGSLLVAMIWCYIIWINFVDHKKAKIFDYKSSVFLGDSSSSEKGDYYFHLKLAVHLVTIALIALIILGFFSVLSQMDLLSKNLSLFLNLYR